MIFPIFNPLYLLFVLPAFILGSVATILLKHWTKKYSEENTINGMIGLDIVKTIALKYDLKVSLENVPEMLSSSYDPRTRVVNVSKDIAYGASVSGTAILAHELGHAIQHQKGELFSSLRSAIVPVVNIGSNLGYILLIMGMILELSTLSWIGLILFSLTTIFILITLPLEIDASVKANKILKETQICFPKEMSKINNVLIAAALTYVAALFQSLGQLLFFFLQVRGVSKKD